VKIDRVIVHNFRSIHDAEFSLYDYTMLVGANNSGKSNVVNALRAFYDDLTPAAADLPRVPGEDRESWIEIEYRLTDEEHESLPDKYKGEDKILRVRKYLASVDAPERAKRGQSNIFAYLPDGELEDNLFFGAKNISQAKLGRVVYVPALSAPGDILKMSGPSPFRSIISFLLKRVVEGSESYADVGKAFEQLNNEANGDEGFLAQLTDPMNAVLSEWGVSMSLSIKAISPEDIVKNQIAHAFTDQAFDGDLPLDRFGHGLQRAVVYELIKLAPRFQDRKPSQKKEFNPDFALILFEEPEAFLHPHQQECMAYSLRQIGSKESQQVLITTHSPIFAGRSAGHLKQIVRLCRQNGVSAVHQLTEDRLDQVLAGAQRLRDAFQAFIDDATKPDGKKKERARKLVENFPGDEVSEQEERFRFQLWMSGDRAAAFFADKVIICEGASEKTLLTYLLENDWSDLRKESVCILDTLGKYNIHRFVLLFNAFGIRHGVILDGDKGRDEHQAVNDMVLDHRGDYTIDIHAFESDLETFLGLPKPPGDRDDRKPIEILKAAAASGIAAEKLAELRAIFLRVSDIETADDNAMPEGFEAPKEAEAAKGT